MSSKLLMIVTWLLIGADIGLIIQTIWLGAITAYWKKKSIGAYKGLYKTCMELNEQTEDLYHGGTNK